MPSTQDILSQAGHSSQDSEFYTPMPDGYVPGRHKYVVVVGTVMSGLGKGIFSSSLAKLLKDKGLRVAPIKMEGYLNIDSGTLNPYRHGEVFVLDDGMETDMDLGTYERMLDQDLTARQLHHQRPDLPPRARQGAPRRLPRPRRADDPPRHRRGEAQAARAGGQAERRRGVRRGRRHRRRLRKRASTSKACASWPTRKAKAASASWP